LLAELDGCGKQINNEQYDQNGKAYKTKSEKRHARGAKGDKPGELTHD